DRALEITPNDSDLITVKAGIYQAEGKLKEAAQLLSEMNVQSPIQPFITKITQLRLERNYPEAIRVLQARQTQFHFASQIDKSTNELILAFMQRLAGDAVGVKTAAQEARNTLKPLCENQPDNSFFAQQQALANSAFGDKEGALKEAERAITLLPSAKDPLSGPTREEVLALIQMMFGESSRPVSTLSRLLQTPYISWLYGPLPAMPALLRLDPMWDPLRTDRVFQKLCEEKRPCLLGSNFAQSAGRKFQPTRQKGVAQVACSRVGSVFLSTTLQSGSTTPATWINQRVRPREVSACYGWWENSATTSCSRKLAAAVKASFIWRGRRASIAQSP